MVNVLKSGVNGNIVEHLEALLTFLNNFNKPITF